MGSIDFDFDRAMCTYLGGDPNSSVIQIGMRDERLSAEYGADAPQIKEVLDKVLAAAVMQVGTSDLTIDQLLTIQLPSVDIVTRGKIAGHVIYYLEH